MKFTYTHITENSTTKEVYNICKNNKITKQIRSTMDNNNVTNKINNMYEAKDHWNQYKKTKNKVKFNHIELFEITLNITYITTQLAFFIFCAQVISQSYQLYEVSRKRIKRNDQ